MSKVSKLKETPTYKNLPRFSHVPMAVINPHSPSKRPQGSQLMQHLEPFTNTLEIKQRKFSPKELPDHLMRAPIDPNAPVKVKKVFVDTKGMTSKQKKEALVRA